MLTIYSFFQVKQTADKALDYIMDVSEEHAPKIRSMKFETYNQEWIQVIAGNGSHRDFNHSEGGSPYGIERDAEVDFTDQFDLPHGQNDHEDYDHEDYVYNSSDAYMQPETGMEYDAQELSAYTSWQ